MFNFTDDVYENGLPKINSWKTSYLLLFGVGFFLVVGTVFNLHMTHLSSLGYEKLIPTSVFVKRYLSLVAMYSVVSGFVIFIFTYAITNLNMNVALGENLQTIGVIIVFLYIS